MLRDNKIVSKTTTTLNLYDPKSRIIQVKTEEFVYTGGTPSFTVLNQINKVISVEINGLEERFNNGYSVTGRATVTLNFSPVVGSKIGIHYTY